MTTIVIHGPPVPWARARRAGSHYFVDEKTATFKARVRLAARSAGVELIPKPAEVKVRIRFVMARPKRGKYDAPIDRRDIDNLIKGCLDALNGLAWDDDGQVTEIGATKVYGAEPSTTITIERR